MHHVDVTYPSIRPRAVQIVAPFDADLGEGAEEEDVAQESEAVDWEKAVQGFAEADAQRPALA